MNLMTMTRRNRIDQPGSGERIHWRDRYWEIKRRRDDRLLLLWCVRDQRRRNSFQFALRWETAEDLEKDESG